VRIRLRVFLAFSVITAIGIYYIADWVRREVRPHYLKSMEASLADTSAVLASVLEADVAAGKIQVADFRSAMRSAAGRRLSARIYDLKKERVDLRVYVTDSRGIVVFDSADGRDEGRDYSKWNDVLLALRGKYGARATWARKNDPSSNVLYVAAPVRAGESIVGVLTVSKPLESVNIFITGARRKILTGALIAGVLFVLLSWLISGWIASPIRRLTAYARAVRDGHRTAAPRLGRGEIAEMGRAFEQMREALEGRKYVEHYVQSLTHEIKSPLSAIRGAAELLEEEMPPERRDKFLANIRAESERIQHVVDRLLELSALEGRSELRNVEEVDLGALVESVTEALRPAAESRKVGLSATVGEGVSVRGERFLLHGALSNLVQNALDFSPEEAEVEVRLKRVESGTQIIVTDSGPGVPDYALERVFERFYSLPRPDSGKKSSGLGLSFAREAAELHGGKITLTNRPAGGAEARLILPL
jgi:two-component system, OmpR family, sensor histidine kinase CreC